MSVTDINDCDKSAACNTNLEATISDIIVCCICLDNYNETFCKPLRLPCDHTMCCKCLNMMLKRARNKKLLCPTCREDHDIESTASLPVDRVVMQLMARVGSNGQPAASKPPPTTTNTVDFHKIRKILIEAIKSSNVLVSDIDSILEPVPVRYRKDIVETAVDIHDVPIFYYAIGKDNLPLVKCLVETGINVDKSYDLSTRHTALMFASMTCHTTIIRYLVDECNADVNKTDAFHQTCLMVACYVGDVDVVKCLLHHGADIHLTCITGKTALHYAAENDCTAAVRILLDNGADVHQQDGAGLTAYDLSLRNGDVQTARVLQHAADKWKNMMISMCRLIIALTIITVIVLWLKDILTWYNALFYIVLINVIVAFFSPSKDDGRQQNDMRPYNMNYKNLQPSLTDLVTHAKSKNTKRKKARGSRW